MARDMVYCYRRKRKGHRHTMKHTTYEIPFAYKYEAERKGSKYQIKGSDTYCNYGEFKESICKAHRLLDYLHNPTTRFDEGSDIESERASVKSSKASLACLYGTDLNEILNEYFSKVASTKWIWVEIIDEKVHEFEMNKTEFREFCEIFGRVSKESGCDRQKVKFLAFSSKMWTWFESKGV